MAENGPNSGAAFGLGWAGLCPKPAMPVRPRNLPDRSGQRHRDLLARPRRLLLLPDRVRGHQRVSLFHHVCVRRERRQRQENEVLPLEELRCFGALSGVYHGYGKILIFNNMRRISRHAFAIKVMTSARSTTNVDVQTN